MVEILGGQLAVFVLAVVSGVLFRYLGMPSLIGQVAAGLVVGSSGVLGQRDIELMRMLGNLGITLLLFLVGLEMNWKELRKVGKASLTIFAGQTVLVMGMFVVVSKLGLGMEVVRSVLFATAMTFSSTIVVVKMLSEKKNISSYSGRISLGVLLLQDLLAIILLAVLPGFKEGIDSSIFFMLMLKVGSLFLLVNVLGHAIVAGLLREVIKSSEDLILFSLAWFFVVVMMAEKVFGVSAEVGSFLAGLSLSTTWGHFQIINKVKTLRDVFLTLFFVVLGLQVGTGRVDWVMVTWLSLLVIFGKFLVTYLWSVFCGVGSRVSFLIGVNMTQVSEFSLVIMTLGLATGLWKDDLSRTITVAGLLTMTISTVMISKSESLFSLAKRKFPGMFAIGKQKDLKKLEMKKHIVLLGCDRTGKSVVSFLEKNGVPFVVVDFNPDIVAEIKKGGGEVIFADATDPDLVDIANMTEARLIISTIKDKNDSLALLTELSRKGIKTPVIVDAETLSEAKELYEAGAAYVVLPHFVSGWHMSQLVKKSIKDKEVFGKFRRKQEKAIKTIYEG